MVVYEHTGSTDLIEAGTVERNFIRRALRHAVDRGLISRQRIRTARMSGPARKIVEEELRRLLAVHSIPIPATGARESTSRQAPRAGVSGG